MRRIRLAFCLLMVGATMPVAAEVVPFADFEIRYDETPFSLAGGTMIWRGKAVVPLTRDTETQDIKGSGTFPFTYEARASGCVSMCTASVSMRVAGKAGIGLIDLSVIDDATEASCKVTCPGGGAFAHKEHRDVYTDKVKMDPASPDPMTRKFSSPGPTLYYTLLADCPAQPDVMGPIPVSVKPGAGAWAVQTLTTFTVADVRAAAPANSKRYGFTTSPFKGLVDRIKDTVEPKIKTRKSRGSEVCYWVERVDQTMDPIQVWLPGLNWGATSCEYKAIDAHEKKHVADAKSLLGGYSRDWVKAIQQANLPRASKPAKAASADAARAAVLARIEAVSQPVISTWVDKYAASLGRIDSDAEYARVKGLCPSGWRE